MKSSAKIEFRSKKWFAYAVLTMLITGCATPPEKRMPRRMFSGPALQSSQIARIRPLNPHIFLEKVDGVEISESTIFGGAGHISGISEVQVMPGAHTLDVRFFMGGLGNSMQNRSSLVSDMQAGHFYSITFDLDDSNRAVRYRIVDHGTDYEKKCARYKSLPAAMFQFDRDFEGKKISPECI